MRELPVTFVSFFMNKDATNGRSLLSIPAPSTILGRIWLKLFTFLHLHRSELLSDADVTITEQTMTEAMIKHAHASQTSRTLENHPWWMVDELKLFFFKIVFRPYRIYRWKNEHFPAFYAYCSSIHFPICKFVKKIN